jgi:hypothetical protein
MMALVLRPDSSGRGQGQNGQEGKSTVHVSILGR